MGKQNETKNFPPEPTRMQSTDNQSYRMVLRRYHCYGCEREFGTMTDVNGNNDVSCSACGSDFVEEMRSLRDNPVQNAVEPQAAPESPMFQQIPQEMPQP